MVTRTFLNKSNTIINGSDLNFGLNPIAMLHYGNIVSRFLIYFDMDNIIKTASNMPNIKHYLNMYNCGSVDVKNFHNKINGLHNSGLRTRTSSFDIIALIIPETWDGGVGFDSSLDFWANDTYSVSKNGSTWFNAYNGKEWETEGIYSTEFLFEELKKYNKKEDSLIIGHQHFDYGNENLRIDITNYVNKVLKGEIENNGLCLCFAPSLECDKRDNTEYVGFFNNNTNTFYQPFIESRSEDILDDKRYDFINGEENEIMLYVQIGGELCNLDELPVCAINDVTYPVSVKKPGVYSAKVKIPYSKDNDNIIIYDEWSNLWLNGENIENVELEIVIKPRRNKINIGNKNFNTGSVFPFVYGLNDFEEIIDGDNIEVKIEYKKEYSNENIISNNATRYRIYTKDGEREINVIDWDYTDNYGLYNSFYIRANEFIPATYYVDIETHVNNETKIFKNILSFIKPVNISNEKK